MYSFSPVPFLKPVLVDNLLRPNIKTFPLIFAEYAYISVHPSGNLSEVKSEFHLCPPFVGIPPPVVKLHSVTTSSPSTRNARLIITDSTTMFV